MATGLTERERELRVERKTLWDAMSPLVEKAGSGQRLTPEERKAYDDRDAELKELDAQLQSVLKMREQASAERAYRDEPDTRGAVGDEKEEFARREQAAFTRYLRDQLRPEDRAYLEPNIRGNLAGEGGALGRDPMTGRRTLGTGLEARTYPDGDTAPMSSIQSVSITGGTAGGYTVPPAFWHNLQIALKAYGGVVPYCESIETPTGAPMSWATNNPTTTVAALLTGENNQLTPQDQTFGLGQINAWTFAAGPFLASFQLINDSDFDVDSYVRDRIAEAIGRAEAAYAWTGTGSSQPLGIYTALSGASSASYGTGGVYLETASQSVVPVGSSTAVSEATLGAMSFKTVFNLITMVDPAYRGVANAGPSADDTPRNPAWFMHDATLQAQRQVSDLYGRPLIQQNVNVGGNTLGDTLAGFPVVVDNNATTITAASTPTTALVSGPVFGSLHHAFLSRHVRDAGVMRLNERFADYMSVGFLGWIRWDLRSNDLRAAAAVSYHS